MSKLKQYLVALRKDEEGATMVEYGLMLALIAIVCILSVQIVGTQANIVFSTVGSYLAATV